MQSGLFWDEGASNPKGELVSLNGVRAVHYQFPQDAADAPTEEYLFIKNDLIYEISLDAVDPYHEEILQSINFI